MNNNTFDWKEIQDGVIKYFKDHPILSVLSVTAVAGISKGVAQWGPHIENVGKYAIDKAAGYLHKPAQAILPDDSVIDANTGGQQAESITA